MTVTTRTKPSSPGYTCITRAIGHFPGSSRSITKSPTETFSSWVAPLCVLDCLEWTDIHLTRSDEPFFGINASVVVLKWDDMKRQGQVKPSINGRPIRKCPGVRISMSEVSGVKGRLFKQASICANSVVISSKVSLTLLATLLR